jgi:hypothetical protein
MLFLKMLWRAPSPPDYFEHRFFDLCHGVVANLIKFEMRKVRQLIGRHDAIDDGRAVGLQGLIDLGMELARLGGPEAMRRRTRGRAR